MTPYDSYVQALKRELVPALGCTEPIALAYASAKARDVLGTFPSRMEICCSGNIIKNVKAVAVPNGGGLRGVDAAAVLGVVGGRAQRELEVLEGVTAQHIERARELIRQGFFRCELQRDAENLYIVATVYSGEHSARVTIVNRHTQIAEIVRDGRVLYRDDSPEGPQRGEDWSGWSIRGILDFAEHAKLDEVEELLNRQIALNGAMAEAGFAQAFGVQIGRTVREIYGNDVRARAIAAAAAGSDARMGGCSLPVVINSGSGNQGLTVSLPVMEYARELGVPRATLHRALLISNLISIHQKHYIGSLSAFCGAVTAACGSGAAITWLCGGDYRQICRTMVNTLANVGGIVCDGAKASCAAKIASSVEAAILAHHLSMRGLAFQPGEGFVRPDVEDTLKSVGHIGRVGMKDTDVEILNLMMDHTNLL